MTSKKEDEPKSYITASIESNLHKEISAEARRNDKSFSKQVQEYRDHVFALEQQVDELRANNVFLTEKNLELSERINKIQDVN